MRLVKVDWFRRERISLIPRVLSLWAAPSVVVCLIVTVRRLLLRGWKEALSLDWTCIAV